MANWWRDIASAIGLILPPDEEMGFGPRSPEYSLCLNCGNCSVKNGQCECCHTRKKVNP